MKPESHVTDQIAAYVLNILDAAEAAEVATHLTTCPDCQAELQAYEAVIDELTVAIPQIAPPPGLKAQLLHEINAHSAPASTPKPQSQTSQWFNWRTWFQKRPLWQPVLVLVLLLLLASNFQLRQRLEEAKTPANFGTVTLNGTDVSANATGIIIISADGQHGTLVVQNLPVLSDTETYQLWLRKDNQRTDGGTFEVDEDGYRAYWVQAPEPLDSYEIFGVTIEPAGGSPEPTGEKVLGN
jgi:anti-sigma-K factor RskA